VAERIVLGDISTGALDDLQRATKIAMDKLLAYGMSKQIGQLAFKPNDRNDGRAWMNFSEDLHAKVEQEARDLVNKAYLHTERTLVANQKQLHDLGSLLLEKKEIMKDSLHIAIRRKTEDSRIFKVCSGWALPVGDIRSD
jgi:AFG3 family protein